MDAQTKDFLKGMIVLWSGAIADIPGGWALCNGAGDTPDLRNRFIVGAGDTYAVDATGGYTSHSHYLTNMEHTHTLPGGGDLEGGGDMGDNTGEPEDTSNTDSEAHLPPYFALAYIMKL